MITIKIFFQIFKNFFNRILEILLDLNLFFFQVYGQFHINSKNIYAIQFDHVVLFNKVMVD